MFCCSVGTWSTEALPAAAEAPSWHIFSPSRAAERNVMLQSVVLVALDCVIRCPPPSVLHLCESAMFCMYVPAGAAVPQLVENSVLLRELGLLEGILWGGPVGPVPCRKSFSTGLFW
jgi:hypothetical protein